VFKLTIKKDTVWSEWIATITYKGQKIASYHTDTKEDALNTGLMGFYQAMQFHNQTKFTFIQSEIDSYKKAYA